MIGSLYGVNGVLLQRQYRDFLSDFRSWKEKSHADRYLIFPENISSRISIDEVSLSQGELYTVVTSKKAKGRAGSIIAIIQGVKSEIVTEHLLKIPSALRRKVKEITLDMASNMKLIADYCFTKATQVVDRFHVQQLSLEALQNIRIKHRWEAIDEENELIIQARKENKTHSSIEYVNGDTKKQLLARSRYLLYKSPDKWTENQRTRAMILFNEFPDIKKAYNLNQDLRNIYNSSFSKEIAMTKLAHWYKNIEDTGFKQFNTVMNTISVNYNTILNYFENRSTNAAAESFNAKIKAFRSQFRGVRNKKYFLFRLTKIYA